LNIVGSLAGGVYRVYHQSSFIDFAAFNQTFSLNTDSSFPALTYPK